MKKKSHQKEMFVVDWIKTQKGTNLKEIIKTKKEKQRLCENLLKQHKIVFVNCNSLYEHINITI